MLTKEMLEDMNWPSEGPKQSELVELLRKCVTEAEKMVHTFEGQYAISNDLRRTIAKANKLLQEIDQNKAIQED